MYLEDPWQANVYKDSKGAACIGLDLAQLLRPLTMGSLNIPGLPIPDSRQEGDYTPLNVSITGGAGMNTVYEVVAYWQPALKNSI